MPVSAPGSIGPTNLADAVPLRFPRQKTQSSPIFFNTAQSHSKSPAPSPTMPTVIPSHEYPEASQVDTNDPDARLQYFFDVARYFGSHNYQVFQVTKESCIQRVCSDLSRMDKYLVVDAQFNYTLESAIWTRFCRYNMYVDR